MVGKDSSWLVRLSALNPSTLSPSITLSSNRLRAGEPAKPHSGAGSRFNLLVRKRDRDTDITTQDGVTDKT